MPLNANSIGPRGARLLRFIVPDMLSHAGADESIMQRVDVIMNRAAGVSFENIAKGRLAVARHKTLPMYRVTNDAHKVASHERALSQPGEAITKDELHALAAVAQKGTTFPLAKMMDFAFDEATSEELSLRPTVRIADRATAIRPINASFDDVVDNLDRSFYPLFKNETESGLKLHVYATNVDETVTSLGRLYDVIDFRGLGAKIATQTFFNIWEGRDDIRSRAQSAKGITIYLPNRVTAQEDAEILVAANTGVRTANARVPGEHFLGNGISYRFEWESDPGRDVISTHYKTDGTKAVDPARPAYVAGGETVRPPLKLQPPSPERIAEIRQQLFVQRAREATSTLRF